MQIPLTFNLRRIVAVLTSLAVVAAVMVGVQATSAQASNVIGVTNGEFGEDQAFDVQRLPAFAECEAGPPATFDSFQVTVSGDPRPYSDTTGGPVSLAGGRYLKVVDVSDDFPDEPWGLALYNSDDEELQYSSGSWNTNPGSVFTESGTISGVRGSSGFFHNSSNDYGTFVSIFTPLESGQQVVYTPSGLENNCEYADFGWAEGWYAFGKADYLNSMPVPGVPVGFDDDAELSDLDIPGLPLTPAFSPEVLDYTGTTGEPTADIGLNPSNPGAAVEVNGVVLEPGSDTARVDLVCGINVIPVVVTSTDGTSTDTYNLSVTRSCTAPNVPGKPTVVSGGVGKALVTVHPTSGGVAATSYLVTGQPGGQTCTVPASSNPLSCSVAGLSQGGNYTFRATATNEFGTSGPSVPSDAYQAGSPAVSKPNKKPAKIKTQGKSTGNKFRVSWRKPSNTSTSRPVSKYRLTVQMRGSKRVIIVKNTPRTKTRYTLTRKQLLRATRSVRGESRSSLVYYVKVRAVNAKGNGPAATTRIVLRAK